MTKNSQSSPGTLSYLSILITLTFLSSLSFLRFGNVVKKN